jgi:hypothetical protein
VGTNCRDEYTLFFFNLLRSLFPALYIRPDELFIKARKGLDRGKLPDQLEGMEISAFSYSTKCAKSCLNSVYGLNSKTSRYVLSTKQKGTEKAKNHLELLSL